MRECFECEVVKAYRLDRSPLSEEAMQNGQAANHASSPLEGIFMLIEVL